VPNAAIDSVVEHDGRTLAVRDLGGSGPDVLLLHGMGGSLEHWSLVVPLLLDRFRLVAMDLPGHGRSAVPAEYDFDADVAAVAAAHSALGLDRPAVVGHSYGGMVAVAAGAARPDQHPVVVNVDGVGFHHAGTPPELREAWRRDDQEEAPGSGDDDWLGAQIRSDQRELAGQGITGVSDELLRRSFRRNGDGLWSAVPPSAYAQQMLAGLRKVDVLARYAGTRCRTVTVLARRDGDTPRDRWMIQHVQVIRDLLALLAPSSPGGEVVEVASGHMIPLEAPDALAAILRSILDAGP
jgi:pimeloyl-ACP methyl ester carboxylesterase